MEKLFGTGVALVTPFNENKDIDYGSLKKLLDFTAEQGVDYYVVLGTTGESATLSAEEKKEVLAFVKENNKHKLPIVYGIGGNNTQAILDTINGTDLSGVDALLSVSPYYNKPSQEGIYQHYKALANASPIPIILYNVPGRTMSNITAQTTLRLAQLDKIIGIKEASGNIEQAMRICKDKPEDFMLISGDEPLTGALYSVGGVGAISVLANAFGSNFKAMKEAAFADDYKGVRESFFSLLDINTLMYTESNPVGVKYLLKLMDICEPYVRLPLVEASPELQNQIADALKELQ